MREKENQHREEPDSGSKRKKQKIRIKYRKRIKIEKRPKGYKLKRFWKKKKKDLVYGLILSMLLISTLFMVAKLVKHKVEMNKVEKDLNMHIPE